MPQVKVSHEIDGKRKDVYGAVKTYLTEKDILSKFGAAMDWDDKACTATIEASNFEGKLSITEKSGKSSVELSIDLPLLLSPFKGKVSEELKKHLSRVKV